MERQREPDGLEISIETCYELTGAELPVLALVAAGQGDEEIAESLGQSLGSIRSTLRRFRDRTGLSGRTLTASAVRHTRCCISRLE